MDLRIAFAILLTERQREVGMKNDKELYILRANRTEPLSPQHWEQAISLQTTFAAVSMTPRLQNTNPRLQSTNQTIGHSTQADGARKCCGISEGTGASDNIHSTATEADRLPCTTKQRTATHVTVTPPHPRGRTLNTI